MYIPKAFREDDIEKLVAFMQAHSFATLISIQDSVPIASHVPLVVTLNDNTVQLSGHLAKLNSQWQTFGTQEALAVFTGPHAYISPSAYEAAENVPTWNYIAVHAYGVPRIITFDRSKASMEEMIDDMISTYGPDYKAQWQGLSPGYRESMMQGIVGFEITVTRLQGKYKLSQNRSATDQANVTHALLQSHDADARAIARAMQQNDVPLERYPQ